MATVAAPVANELLIVGMLSQICRMIIHTAKVMSPSVLLLVQLPVYPVLFSREVSQGLEGQVLGSDQTLDVSESAGGTFRAEAQNVVHANFLIHVFWSVVELTEISAYFTETSLVVGADLQLF